jgi:tyrosyl-tRNA synthetase
LEGSDINHAMIVLADEATALLHGRDCLEQMHETVETMSKGEGESTDGLPRIFVTVSDFMGDGVRPCRSVYMDLKLGDKVEKMLDDSLLEVVPKLGDMMITDETAVLPTCQL